MHCPGHPETSMMLTCSLYCGCAVERTRPERGASQVSEGVLGNGDPSYNYIEQKRTPAM